MNLHQPLPRNYLERILTKSKIHEGGSFSRLHTTWSGKCEVLSYCYQCEGVLISQNAMLWTWNSSDDFPELTAAPSFSAACVGNMWQPSHGAWVRGRHAEDRRRVAIRAAECHLAQGVLGLGPVSRWVPHPEAMMMHHVVKECKDMEHATLCLCSWWNPPYPLCAAPAGPYRLPWCFKILDPFLSHRWNLCFEVVMFMTNFGSSLCHLRRYPGHAMASCTLLKLMGLKRTKGTFRALSGDGPVSTIWFPAGARVVPTDALQFLQAAVQDHSPTDASLNTKVSLCGRVFSILF